MSFFCSKLRENFQNNGCSPHKKTKIISSKLNNSIKKSQIAVKPGKSLYLNSKFITKKASFKLNRLMDSSNNSDILENFKKFEEKQIATNQKNQDEINGTINLLNQIRILIKAANLFKFRTKFRGMKFINDKQTELIGDISNFIEKTQKERFLKRFTEKNFIKRLYYQVMSGICSNLLVLSMLNNFDCFFKFIFHKVPVIKPYQKIKVLWDVLILITIVSFFFIIPLQLSFKFNYEEEIQSFLISNNFNVSVVSFTIFIPEVLLILDTLLKFITGYYDNGIVIIDTSKIMKHYIKKGLIFDILSYCPILAQSILQNNSIGLHILQLLLFCKLKRVQIIMHNFQQMISLNGKNDYILSLVILTFHIIFFCHINACIWHSVAFYYPSNNVKTWLDYSGIKDYDWVRKYYYSLYWSVSVMVTIGFGEKVSPQNNAELLVGVLIFLSSALFFGYNINRMREIFYDMVKNEKEYKESIIIINQYMRSKNIDFELQGKVRKYLEYTMYKETNHEKEEIILNKLTHALKNEVIIQANSKKLYEIPLFSKNFSAQTIEKLAFVIKEVRFSPEEYIYKRGDIDDFSIFIVSTGNLDFIQENEFGINNIYSFKEGEIFGSLCFFTDDPRESSVRSRNFSTLYEIKKSDFLKIIRKTPEDYEKYLQIKDQMKLYSSYENINLQCLSCSKLSHLFNQCPLLHYIPDNEFLIKRLLYNSKQERSLYERKNKRKYNSRSNNYAVQAAILSLSSIFSNDESYDSKEESKLDNMFNVNKFEENHNQQQYKEKSDFPQPKFPVNGEKQFFDENLKSNSSIIENFNNKIMFDDKPEKAFRKNKILRRGLTLEDSNKHKIDGFSILKKNRKFYSDDQIKLSEKAFIHKNCPNNKIMNIDIKRNRKFCKEVQIEPSKNAFIHVPSEKNSPKNKSYKNIACINREKGKLSPSIATIINEKLFDYEFEMVMNYNYYFPANNSLKVLKTLMEKQISPCSRGSISKRRSVRKKLIQKITNSKLIIDSMLDKSQSKIMGKDNQDNKK